MQRANPARYFLVRRECPPRPLRPIMKCGDGATDADVIAAVKAGDTGAFAILVRRYEPIVAATVIGMMGPTADAEEVGQETMIKLFRSLDQFKGEAKLSTYLTRIAVNASLDALRRRQRGLKRFFSPPPETDGANWQDDLPCDSDHGRDFENRQAVEYALMKLKPEFRAVAVLRLMQGLTVEEVSHLLQIPEGTVLSRLSRAKTQLADVLRKELNYD